MGINEYKNDLAIHHFNGPSKGLRENSFIHFDFRCKVRLGSGSAKMRNLSNKYEPFALF